MNLRRDKVFLIPNESARGEVWIRGRARMLTDKESERGKARRRDEGGGGRVAVWLREGRERERERERDRV